MAYDRRSRATPAPSLSEEDAALWERVTRTARPLRKDHRPHGASARAPQEAAASDAAEAPRPIRSDLLAGGTKRREPRLPPLARMAQREARRLSRGQIAIEARIDLHGLRQREAHQRLKSFLVASQMRGLRHVLVITGKGERDLRHAAPFWADGERGVLKRLVPLWLKEPELRPYVVAIAVADPRHGGEGALYVQLRRLR